jgi:hypothetical protein
MTDIPSDNQRLIEEDIFGLLRRNSMLLPVLLRIRVVPIETNALIQRALSFRHDYQYTMDIYITAEDWLNPVVLPGCNSTSRVAEFVS